MGAQNIFLSSCERYIMLIFNLQVKGLRKWSLFLLLLQCCVLVQAVCELQFQLRFLVYSTDAAFQSVLLTALSEWPVVVWASGLVFCSSLWSYMSVSACTMLILLLWINNLRLGISSLFFLLKIALAFGTFCTSI